ncbi:hypothetical protein [Uliginosibacterium flavum]|uniref:Helix-turn-helix domain-containing protein n=1 Tax=Uliginosibacterium flavum TaxID=1396831 RepID=A0ABV2TK72_9RHOO
MRKISGRTGLPRKALRRIAEAFVRATGDWTSEKRAEASWLGRRGFPSKLDQTAIDNAVDAYLYPDPATGKTITREAAAQRLGISISYFTRLRGERAPRKYALNGTPGLLIPNNSDTKARASAANRATIRDTLIDDVFLGGMTQAAAIRKHGVAENTGMKWIRAVRQEINSPSPEPQVVERDSVWIVSVWAWHTARRLEQRGSDSEAQTLPYPTAAGPEL